MLRKKRYLLPDITDHDCPLKIPRSTLHSRSKSRKMHRDTSELSETLHEVSLISSDDAVFKNVHESDQSEKNSECVHEEKKSIKNKTISTPDELEARVLSSMLKNGWTHESVKDVFDILKSMPVESFKIPSFSKFMKKHCQTESQVKDHFICPTCRLILVIDSQEVYGDSGDKSFHCEHCKVSYTESHLRSNFCHFVTIPIFDSLSALLTEAMSNGYKMQERDEDTIESVRDGEKYKELLESNKISNDDFTFTLHYDGIPLFKSSKVTAWPVLLTLNEMKESFRKENVFVVGLWISKRQPDTNVYLLSVLEELRDLEKGVLWTDRVSKERKISRFFVILCTADAVARCKCRNMSQFNGKYGCGQCYHPGKVVLKGKGHCRVYPPIDDCELRKNDDWVSQSKLAHKCDAPVFGIHDVNPFMLLSAFYIVDSFVFDAMHTIFLGITRNFISMWLHRSNFKQRWYIGKRRNLLNKRLLNQLPPSEVQRNPRSFDEMKFFKASEWMNILLFYSVSIFDGVLDVDYYQHWLLLIELTHLSTQSGITRADISRIDFLSREFIAGVVTLYGEEYCSYNVHQLSHVSDCVKNWGPLHVYSCFVYETNLGILKRSIHNGHRPMEQAINYISRLKRSHQLNSKHRFSGQIGETCNNFCTSTKEIICKKKISSSKFLDLNLSVDININVTDIFLKFNFKRKIYCSSMHQGTKKNSDSFFLLKSGECCKLICLTNDGKKLRLIIEILKSKKHSNLPLYKCKEANPLSIVDLDQLGEKLFFVKNKLHQTSFYLFKMPHLP